MVREGATAVVTGGGRGIGQKISVELARNGADVVVADLDPEEMAETKRLVEGTGRRAVCVEMDLTEPESVDAAVERALEAFDTIDILVNNAGIAHVGDLEHTAADDFDRIYRVNVKGVYHCMHACIASMKQRGGGVIINMASVAASVGIADRFAYSMSKGAVLAMTYSAAKDYAKDGVRVVSISPARVHTPFVDGFLRANYPGCEEEMFAKLAATQPIGRMGTPQEIADLALYLCSDEAAFATGTDYPIDGGFLRLNT
jgi:NAD(P)-dependent dehydrogenase (short-subunit alcohol dehydrogenase family)